MTDETNKAKAERVASLATLDAVILAIALVEASDAAAAYRAECKTIRDERDATSGKAKWYAEVANETCAENSALKKERDAAVKKMEWYELRNTELHKQVAAAQGETRAEHRKRMDASREWLQERHAMREELKSLRAQVDALKYVVNTLQPEQEQEPLTLGDLLRQRS